jgi:hypothetical protein
MTARKAFMTPHVTRQGIPVCNRGNTCGVINSDQLFATNRYHVSNAGRARLAEFFRETWRGGLRYHWPHR